MEIIFIYGVFLAFSPPSSEYFKVSGSYFFICVSKYVKFIAYFDDFLTDIFPSCLFFMHIGRYEKIHRREVKIKNK